MIDQNNAPTGTIATASVRPEKYRCLGCVYRAMHGDCELPQKTQDAYCHPCHGSQRPDGNTVIFIKQLKEDTQ